MWVRNICDINSSSSGGKNVALLFANPACPHLNPSPNLHSSSHPSIHPPPTTQYTRCENALNTLQHPARPTFCSARRPCSTSANTAALTPSSGTACNHTNHTFAHLPHSCLSKGEGAHTLSTLCSVYLDLNSVRFISSTTHSLSLSLSLSLSQQFITQVH